MEYFGKIMHDIIADKKNSAPCSGASRSPHGRTVYPFVTMYRQKSLAKSGFAGTYLAWQRIYALSPATAFLLRNESTMKGVIYFRGFLSETKQ